MGTQNVLGTNYPYPDVNDKPWGDEHIDWATAVSNATNTLQAQIDNIDDVEIPALQAQINLSGQANTASNQGSGVGLVLPKVGVDLPFKTIVAGTNVGLAVGVDTVTINATGTGDVNGPLGALDNQVTVFDGITGKLIKMSGVVIDISNNVSSVNNLTTIGSATIGGDITVTGLSDTAANSFRNKTSKTTGTTSTVGNLALSNSSGSFSSSSTSFVNVTNLSVTITTRGNPVKLYLVNGQCNVSATNFPYVQGYVQFKRDATILIQYSLSITVENASATADPNLQLPSSCLLFLDTPSSGTYTYTVQVKVQDSSNTAFITNVRLVAEELI